MTLAHAIEGIIREQGSGWAHVMLVFKSGHKQEGYLWELLTYENADDSTDLYVRVGDPVTALRPFCTDYQVDSIDYVDLLEAAQ